MPKLDPIYSIDADLSIGVATQPKTGNKVWYARCYWRLGQENYVKTTKVPFKDTPEDRREAERAARNIHAAFYKRVSSGLSPTRQYTVQRVLDDYEKRIEKESHENDIRISDGLEPISSRYLKGHVAAENLEEIKFQCQIVRRFFSDKNFFIERNIISSSSKPLIEREANLITDKQLSSFSDWASQIEKSPPRTGKYSPSRVNKFCTRLTHIWRLAKEDGIVKSDAKPPRQKPNIKKRKRPNLKEEDYLKIIEYAENKWQKIIIDKDKLHTYKEIERRNSRDCAFQFYCFILFISYTGIRPWKGEVIKNIPTWDDYITIKKDEGYESGEKRILKRNEKSHEYAAAILPNAWDALDKLEELYKERGIESKYIFAHLDTGEPIKYYRKQWETMVKELGLEQFTPYSLRGYFMSCRLRYGDMTIEKLAAATGTSIEMIFDTYNDFLIEKEWDVITKSSGDYKKIDFNP